MSESQICPDTEQAEQGQVSPFLVLFTTLLLIIITLIIIQVNSVYNYCVLNQITFKNYLHYIVSPTDLKLVTDNYAAELPVGKLPKLKPAEHYVLNLGDHSVYLCAANQSQRIMSFKQYCILGNYHTVNGLTIDEFLS